MRSDQYEFFDLEGFHVREDITGHVVAVQNMHSSVMSAVYKHYFLKILLPFINSQRKPTLDENENIFVMTMDGDQNQIEGMDAEVIAEFTKAQVTVIKLPAATSAFLQPCDVSVCFRELKRLVRQGRYFGTIRDSTQASLKTISSTLLRRDNCAWSKLFLERLEYSVNSIAPVLPLAFHFASIMSTFQSMGWSPFDLPTILARGDEVPQPFLTACERAWPKLFIMCG